MNVFLVIMYRWGERTKHSYPLGIWSSLDEAKKAKYTEETWRGGKYKGEITSWKIDGNEYDSDSRFTIVVPVDGQIENELVLNYEKKSPKTENQ